MGGQEGMALTAALDALSADFEAAGGEVGLCVRHFERDYRYERGADGPFQAASTIKLPILVALHDAVARGRLRLHAQVRLRPEDQVTGSGVLQLLSPGLRLPLRDLAELMIATSDNAATNILLRLLGLERVNACLEGLGLHQIRVHRPLQVIPVAAGPTNTVTAGELAELLGRIAAGTVVSWEACRRMVATLKRQQVRSALPALLPDGGGAVGALPRWELAHKTGGIPGHQHDVGLLYLPGQTIVVAVLTRGGPSAAQARGFIAQVGLAVLRAWDGGA